MPQYKNHIKADVIVLGCSLPGLVIAHNLKKKFGDTMDIVVLDLASTMKSRAKLNVGFTVTSAAMILDDGEEEEPPLMIYNDSILDGEKYPKIYMTKYSHELNVALPDCIMDPLTHKSDLIKVFQNKEGRLIHCSKNYHDFSYLNAIERYELEKYQDVLDYHMNVLFQASGGNLEAERKQLLYFDRTTMEEHLCGSLLLSTSRDVMRTIVRLVCGTSSESVSLLFYLHQCYRTRGSRNHIDGNNTRLREKLLGYCRERIANRMLKNIADITMPMHSIKKIRADHNDEVVVLEPEIGETDYICQLLAMAVRPDQLTNMNLEEELRLASQVNLWRNMSRCRAKKFQIQYEENFCKRLGFSGDILSLRGPITWAMERPIMSQTGSVDKYFTLNGFLEVNPYDDYTENTENDSYKAAVIEQLVGLFGRDAENPVTYAETAFDDVFTPRCGDYLELRDLATNPGAKFLEWGAMDVFAEGDVAAAIEAGHTAYLHVARCLRPQALNFDDITIGGSHDRSSASNINILYSSLNLMNGTQLLVGAVALALGTGLLMTIINRRS